MLRTSKLIKGFSLATHHHAIYLCCGCAIFEEWTAQGLSLPVLSKLNGLVLQYTWQSVVGLRFLSPEHYLFEGEGWCVVLLSCPVLLIIHYQYSTNIVLLYKIVLILITYCTNIVLIIMCSTNKVLIKYSTTRMCKCALPVKTFWTRRLSLESSIFRGGIHFKEPARRRKKYCNITPDCLW